MALDKKKPYGEIHGDETLRKYEQDGKYFDASGNELGADGKVVKAAAPAKGAAEAKASDVDAQLAKQ